MNEDIQTAEALAAPPKPPTQRKPRTRPTWKQKNFAREYVRNNGNGTQAALATYNTNDPLTAKAIGSENLTKPTVQAEISKIASQITEDYLLDAARAGLDGNKLESNVRSKYLELLMKYKGLLIERREVTTKRAAITRADLDKLDTDMLMDVVLGKIKTPVSQNETKAETKTVDEQKHT